MKIKFEKFKITEELQGAFRINKLIQETTRGNCVIAG